MHRQRIRCKDFAARADESEGDANHVQSDCPPPWKDQNPQSACQRRSVKVQSAMFDTRLLGEQLWVNVQEVTSHLPRQQLRHLLIVGVDRGFAAKVRVKPTELESGAQALDRIKQSDVRH